MRLTPKEIEKLLLHCAGELAKDRKNRGIKLNFVESTALISSECPSSITSTPCTAKWWKAWMS